jgi:hypothetical protein
MVMASSMSGKAVEKSFVFNDDGRNGKGLLSDFLEEVYYGDYFQKSTLNYDAI